MGVTNPQRIRIVNQRNELQKWRSHKPWKKMVEEHAHVPGAVCVHCGKHHKEPMLDKKGNQKYDKRGRPQFYYLTINHITRTRYWTEELYCTWDESDMEVCCTTCNWRIESGEKPCPVCHTTYIFWREYSCQACWDKAHPIEAQKRNSERDRRVAEAKAIKDRIKADKKAERERYKIDHPKRKSQSRVRDRGTLQLV